MKSDSIFFRCGRRPFILAGLTAVTGVCLSVYIQAHIAQTEAATAQLTAETLRLNTGQELTLFADVLESVCALHALSDAVNQAAMTEFVEKGLIYQHTVLGTFGLTQKISAWMRIGIEGNADAQPGASYHVVKQGPNGTWIPSEPKSAYYPLTWRSRPNGLDFPIGFDFSSLGKAACQTIAQIEHTRHTALVPFPADSDSNAPSYWVFAPVLPRPSETLYTPNTVIGFAVAKLRPDTLLHRVAERATPSPKLKLTLSVPPDARSGETITLEKNTWIYKCPLNAIGTQWLFECSLPVAATGRRSVTAFIAGLIITALMTSQLIFLGGRTRKIEAEVRARTDDLHTANAQLEKNLRERVRLEEEISELAAHERRRIGRDLHDSLGQKLTGAVFLSRSLLDYFSTIGKQKPEGVSQAAEGRGQESDVRNQKSEISNRQSVIDNHQIHAKTLNETLKSAVSQVRNMARGLAPVALNDESLGKALDQLVEEMTGLYGVSCEVAECAEPAALDRKTKEQLYLIAREAVNNAARHAQAGRITVRLTCSESGWKLCITDDGKGLPDTQPAGEGMGIRIMRHRAGLIGAGLAITAAQSKGTCVEVMRQY
ncbi:MAG: sensor histidine kinase [Pontiellaceae bacterium]|nr:sensor histidine kinase [Pontiellaceae bacterium]